MAYKWFKASEIGGLKHELLSKLDEARGLAGTPFVLSSGFRLPTKNESVGGVSDSSHLFGLGVDIKATTSVARFKIIDALLAVGFCRIGIYKTHVHADVSKVLPQNVIWLG